MAKQYYLAFGGGNPATYTGLSPTFTIFNINGISAIAAPAITESPAGSGLYGFVYGPTQSIVFQIDGGSVISTTTDRYIKGALDPIQAVDQQVGYVTDSFGSSAIDPTTLFGYLKRLLENFEGDAVFNKTAAIWSIFTRGSSTLIRTKTVTNTSSVSTKSGL